MPNKAIPKKSWVSLSSFVSWLKENRKSEKIVDFLGYQVITNTHVYSLCFGQLTQRTIEEHKAELKRQAEFMQAARDAAAAEFKDRNDDLLFLHKAKPEKPKTKRKSPKPRKKK